jgi:hypothetical protein
MRDPIPCGSCAAKNVRALIIFVPVANNAGHKLRPMPLNAEPDPGGNVAVLKTGTGALRGRVLTKNQKPVPPDVVYCPHFATCVAPAAHRKPRRDKGRTAVQAGGRAKRPAPTGTLFGGDG